MQLESSTSADFLIDGAKALDLDLSRLVAHRMLQYLVEIQEWNKRFNLTSILDPREMIIKHLLDSLSGLADVEGRRLLDVGSGAGLPGIPLALMREDLEVVLLDSNGKKITFLNHIIGLL